MALIEEYIRCWQMNPQMLLLPLLLLMVILSDLWLIFNHCDVPGCLSAGCWLTTSISSVQTFRLWDSTAVIWNMLFMLQDYAQCTMLFIFQRVNSIPWIHPLSVSGPLALLCVSSLFLSMTVSLTLLFFHADQDEVKPKHRMTTRLDVEESGVGVQRLWNTQEHKTFLKETWRCVCTHLVKSAIMLP